IVRKKKKCDAFWWIDPEISSPWYKYQMFELYVTQHPKQRFLFVEHLRAQDQLKRLQVEHDGLVSKFEQSKKSCRSAYVLVENPHLIWNFSCLGFLGSGRFWVDFNCAFLCGGHDEDEADIRSRPLEQTSGADLQTIQRRQSQLTYSFEDTCDIGTRCRNSTPKIAGRSKDGSGLESVASVLIRLLGDEGAATTSKVVKAEPHSCSQLRSQRRHFRRNHLQRNRS
ncbi:hypothetical protein Tco_0834715, partial [Tanacetum coccineum]